MSRTVDFEEDNLIYNRFDLIYRNDFTDMEFQYQDHVYSISLHQDGEKAVMNVWGKVFPQCVFDQAVEEAFRMHAGIRYIEITQGGNNYRECLCRSNDYRIMMPATKNDLMQRIKSKSRNTLKRKLRILEEQYGSLDTVSYGLNVPSEYVELYFKWKKESHGINYNMSPAQYLEEYHVTDTILVKAGGRPVGIMFFCMAEDTAYLENFSFDSELARYSPGYITYVLFLEELISKRCRLLFLGGGDYEYKKRFGAEERTVYNGAIYREEVFEEINLFFDTEGIRTYAIYGLGTGGEEFLCIRNRMKAELIYGIDRTKKEIDTLQTCTLEEEFPEADAILITLKTRNAEVEKFLKQRFSRIFYWEDMAKRNNFKQL